MPNAYQVRLAISQYGDQFRAELFTEDLGDTDGAQAAPQTRRAHPRGHLRGLLPRRQVAGFRE
jgi:hypothetical protein